MIDMISALNYEQSTPGSHLATVHAGSSLAAYMRVPSPKILLKLTARASDRGAIVCARSAEVGGRDGAVANRVEREPKRTLKYREIAGKGKSYLVAVSMNSMCTYCSSQTWIVVF